MRLTRRALAVLLMCLSWPAGAQFANGFEGAAPPPVDPCAGDPNIKPAGFVRAQVTWAKMFYGQHFPRTPSFLTPVGSWTLRSGSNSGPPIRGKYLTVPFVPTPNQNYRLSWVNTQAVAAAGYGWPRSADKVMVSISECSGDFRRPDGSSPNPAIRYCRAYNKSAVMYFGTAENANCKLTPGRQYWLNVIFANPYNLDPSVSTCKDQALRCEVNVSQ